MAYKLLLGLCSFLLTHALAYDALRGQAVVMEFDKKTTQGVWKNNHSLALLAHPSKEDRLLVFLAVPYQQKTPIELLYQTPSGTKTLRINVHQGDYTSEILRVEPSKVSPPKEVLKRIAKEREEALALYTTITPKRFWHQPFTLPLESAITSAYGTARLYNDTLKSYHTGVDLRAPLRTPIYAINDGVVVLAKERYYAGNSIIIDHGEGIYSTYYHLDTLSFRAGEKISKGEILGLSGQSGRVTGPHLHFGIMLHGTPVDPLHFIETLNSLF